MNESIRIHRALITIATILDQLENVPQDVKDNKHFRSRRQLIDDILDGVDLEIPIAKYNGMTVQEINKAIKHERWKQNKRYIFRHLVGFSLS